MNDTTIFAEIDIHLSDGKGEYRGGKGTVMFIGSAQLDVTGVGEGLRTEAGSLRKACRIYIHTCYIHLGA